jgi:hypothetical protein
MRPRLLVPVMTLLCVVLICLTLCATAAQASFGFKPESLSMRAENRDGTLDTQAGSHPYAFSFHFEVNTSGDSIEGGAIRDLITDLPPGMIGDPLAVPRCPREAFEGIVPNCALSTQIGVVRVNIPGIGEAFGPLFNLTPPPGVPVELGFSAGEFVALVSAKVDSERGYAGHATTSPLPVEVSSVTAIIWGTPADPGHDSQRGFKALEGGPPVRSDAPLLPFFTLPTTCGETAPELTFSIDSKLAPGAYVSESAPLRDEGGNASPLTGCEAVPYEPDVLVGPTTSAADSAAGVDVQLKLPNRGLLNPKDGAVTETEAQRMVVTLPQGVIANPAAVNGLGVCTPAQFKAASAVAGPGQGCPSSSKLGDLVAQTPLLEEPVEGSVYVAAPHDNPFGSLIALYFVAQAPQRGVLVKQAGEVQPDPVTGQLTTTVNGLPPVPYSALEVRLREGPRAPLITPQTCGIYTTTAKLYPFSDPGTAVVRSAPFTISTGAKGGPCAATEAQLPNHPTLSAGASWPIAGSYSPFVFKLSREDGEQRFGSLEATLPEGLVAKLAGIPYCPEAAIATAASRTGEGQGAVESASPSCPSASQIGTVLAGAGAGPSPYFAPGKAYLAGPYKGAPFSLVIVTPAIAGPFDLGTVVVRSGLYVDETSAKVTVKSDPLPTILHGLPLDVRSVAVTLDRHNFALNPTSCEEKAITARLTSLAGAVASLSNRFRVGSCKGLDFSPKLSLKLSGGTTRAKHPALKVVLTQPSGQANLARFSLTLPPTEFVDPDHVANPCTRPQFKEGKCPSSSVLGKVRAFSPLLEKPLEGPIYFRANGGERELPDAVADLNGQVHFVSVGFVDALHHKGSEESRIRTTIASVPDAPLSKVVIELKGGKKHGLLVNSANICKSANRAIVKMTAQNGKTQNSEPKIATSCGKK